MLKLRFKLFSTTLAQAAKILQNEDKDSLVRLLLDWAKTDAKLRERILLHTARQTGGKAATKQVQRSFEIAVRTNSFVHYREASAWSRRVHVAIEHRASLYLAK